MHDDLLTAAVTGVNGVIGRHVTSLLLEHGWQVRVLSRRQTDLDLKCKLVRGGVGDSRALDELVNGVYAVFHCAGEKKCVDSIIDVNVHGTRRLALASVKAGVKVFCHISSAGVHGPVPKAALIDETFPCKPETPYERSKLEAERQLFELDSQGMRICILRPTTVFDQRSPGLVLSALRWSLRDRLLCFLKGREGAHLVHANDVAAAAMHVVVNPSCEGVYFIGCDEDERNTVAGVSEMVRRMAGHDRACSRHLPAFVPHVLRRLIKGTSLHGDVRFSSARLLQSGFRHQLGLEYGVKQAMSRSEWFGQA